MPPPEPNVGGAPGVAGGGNRTGRRRPLRAGGSTGLGLAFDTSGIRTFTADMGKATEAVEKLFAPFKDVEKLDKKLDEFFKGIKTNLTQIKEQSDDISFDFGTGTGAGGGMYSEHQQSVSQMTQRAEQMRGDGGGGGGGLLAGILGGPGRQAAGFALGTTAGLVSTMGPGTSQIETAANLYARQGGFAPEEAEAIRRNLQTIPGFYGRQDIAASARTLRTAGVGPRDLEAAQRGVGGLVQAVPGLTGAQAAQTAAGLYSARTSNLLAARGILTSPGGRERPADEILRDVMMQMFPGGRVTEENLERLRSPGSPERLRLNELAGSPEAAAVAIEQTQIQANLGGGAATRDSALPKDLSEEDRRRAGMDDTLEERTRQLTETGVEETAEVSEQFRSSLHATIDVQEEAIEMFGRLIDEGDVLAKALGNIGGIATGLGGTLGVFRGALDTVISLLILRRVGGLAGGVTRGGAAATTAGGAALAPPAGGASRSLVSKVGRGAGWLGIAGLAYGAYETSKAWTPESAAPRPGSAESLLNTYGVDSIQFGRREDEGDPVRFEPGSHTAGIFTPPSVSPAGAPIPTAVHVNSASSEWNWRSPPGIGDPVLRGPGRDTGMNADFLGRLKQMFADNPKLSLTSGYRSTAEQARLYARWQARVPGQAPAAPPGRSNHEKGTAADIGPRSEYGWLAANAPKYGLKKPMSYEPWHWEPSNTVGGAATPGAEEPGGGAGGAPAAPAVSTLTPLTAALASGGQTAPVEGGGAEGTGAGGAAALTDINASQTDIIKKIVEVGQGMGASPKAILAAVETGWMESGMRNLRHGDRDSLGVFQQRPSQGWGTPEQILNVAFAARSFLSRAMKVDLPTAGQVAAAVQRPAARYRGKYQQNREKAVASLASVGYNASGVAGDPIPAGGGWSHPVPSAGTGMVMPMPGGGGGGGGLRVEHLTLKVEIARGSVEEAERFGRHLAEVIEDRTRLAAIGQS